jgi:hypothetical protein
MQQKYTSRLVYWIDIYPISFHVEFENGLSISGLKNRAVWGQKFTTGNRKSQMCEKAARPL